MANATRRTRFTRALGAVALVAVAGGALDVTPASAAIPVPPPKTLVISEFRLRGPSGVGDEFIEVQNISAGIITITDSGTGTGFAIAASDGVARCVIPNNTVIPRFGHFLCVGPTYSIGAYPAGAGTTATGDATYATEIADNAGIALFTTSVPGNFAAGQLVDAVGSTSEANTLYREGVGYAALTPFSIDYSFYRNLSTGSISTFALTTATPGVSEDTDDNATDFVFVDTNGTSAGAGQRLGAPGPENLSSPIPNGALAVSLLDPCVDANTAPNAVFDGTSVPASNATFGTLDIRRTITNNTGGPVTRLRLRVADQRTFPAPSGFADLRDRTATATTATVDRAPCGTGTSSITVNGTTLETPPNAPNGSAFNSSLGVGVVTLGTPLAAGASVDVRLFFGIQQTGKNSVRVIAEALTSGSVTTPTLTCLGVTSGTMTDFCSGNAPVAAPDTFYGTEDATLTIAAPGVLGNDTDEGTMTAVLVTGPTHGDFQLNSDGSFTFDPDLNFNGNDTFTYKANDGSLNSSVTTVTLALSPSYDAPEGVADTFGGVEDVALNIAAPGILGNDTNVDGLTLSATMMSGPAHGTLTLNSDGSFSYMPTGDYHGTDSFTYEVLGTGGPTRTDGQLQTLAQATTVTINVTGTNDPPVSTGDTGSTNNNAPLVNPAPGPLANDVDADGDPLTAVLVTGPAHGVLLLAADGSYTYTPNTGYVGTDSFTYAASDGTSQGTPVTVTLTVLAGAGVLPATGANSLRIVGFAAWLTLAGGLMLISRRRRLV